MTLALDASTPAETVLGDVDSGTSAAFSPPASSKILVSTSANGDTTPPSTDTVTGTGSLTYTLIDRASGIAGALVEGFASQWYTDVGSAPGAVTVSSQHNDAGDQHRNMQVLVFTDAATGMPSSFKNDGVAGISLSLTTPAANCWVWGVFSDWNANAVPWSVNAGTSMYS